MAISTYGITLKWGATEATMTKVIDIKDFPDLGGAPEMLEVTTLSDAAQAFILGIQSMSAMEFTANYTKADFQAVDADSNTDMYYSLELGTNGSEGVFKWRGQHTCWPVGAGVNAPVDMKIAIAPSTKPTLASA